MPFSRSEWQTRFPASGTSVALQKLVRVEGYELAALLDLDDHLPIAIVPLAPDHPGQQIVITLPRLFEIVQVPPGGFFHRNALDLAAGIACGGDICISCREEWYLLVCTFATMNKIVLAMKLSWPPVT